MTTTKKSFTLLLAACLSTGFFSCDEANSAKEEASTNADTSTSTAAASPESAAFKPFDVAVITHEVKDYAAWKPAFDADASYRKDAGLETQLLGRSADNANKVTIVMNAADVAKAKTFVADPRLKEVMTKAGVVSKPSIQFFNVIRFNENAKTKQWVVVTHKVKDFDKWVKVFHNEGKEKRASQGMIDASIARGMDDPNLVQLIFYVTDMNAAKAAIFSEEKKQLMISAGVEGVPEIVFYNTAE